MPNPEHIDVVRKGWMSVDSWRDRHPADSLDLGEAEILGVDLTNHANSFDKGIAPFYCASLKGAKLKGTSFQGQNLGKVDLRGADLADADLGGTFLDHADLSGANLNGVILRGARLVHTNLANTDLSHVSGLDTVRHEGPCILSLETLRNLKGHISPGMGRFLRGCGMTPWEIELVRLYDRALTAAEIAEIISVGVFSKRTDGPLYIGGH